MALAIELPRTMKEVKEIKRVVESGTHTGLRRLGGHATPRTFAITLKAAQRTQLPTLRIVPISLVYGYFAFAEELSKKDRYCPLAIFQGDRDTILPKKDEMRNGSAIVVHFRS